MLRPQIWSQTRSDNADSLSTKGIQAAPTQLINFPCIPQKLPMDRKTHTSLSPIHAAPWHHEWTSKSPLFSQVGQAPVLANPVTKTLGGSSPNNIQQVIDPAATSASSVSLAAAALAPYMIQYYAEFGVPGALLAPAGTAVNPPVTKVFVNCVGTPASGIGTPGGTNVIGSVTVSRLGSPFCSGEMVPQV